MSLPRSHQFELPNPAGGTIRTRQGVGTGAVSGDRSVPVGAAPTVLPPIDPVPHLRPLRTCSFTADARLLVDIFEAFEGNGGRPLGAGPIDRVHEIDIPPDGEIRLHPTTLRQFRAACPAEVRR